MSRAAERAVPASTDDRAPLRPADFSPAPLETVWEATRQREQQQPGTIHQKKKEEEVELELERFYGEYLPALLATKDDPTLAMELRLGRGDMVVVNTHRGMHGRRAFRGAGRNMVGAYVGLDEFESACRMRGLPHDISVEI